MSKPTPEEKLFAVIQGAKYPSVRGAAHALSLASVSAQAKAWVRTWDLPRANQALAVLVGGLALWCVATPLFMRSNIDRLIDMAKRSTPPFTIAAPLEGLHSSEEYAQLIQSQDPFHVGTTTHAAETSPAETPPQRPAEPDFSTTLQQLKLVGVSWVPDPIAMVEDTTTHQTNFLKLGATIGPFTVKEILPNHVILHAGDKDYELF